MGRIKLDLRSLSIPEKIAKARQILAALTGNPNFPTPNPPLPVIKAAFDDLETANIDLQATKQSIKTKTDTQDEKEGLADQVLTQLASYVESVAGAKDELIHSAGMDTKSAPSTSSAAPTQPQDLSATAGDNDGAIDLAWDKVSNAKSYVIDRSVDPPTGTSWQHAGVSTKTSTTITGLTSGTRYWFRVAAIGATGQSPWSDPATKLAP